MRMPGKGKKKKGRKGSQRPPTARAAKSPVCLGTLLTPGVEAGESYGTPVDNRDWYKDFQSSESDSVDPYIPASDRGSDCEEEAPMEVEEYPHRDLPFTATPKAQRARGLQHPRHRPGHAAQ
ncbi:hypothetical protein P4O66_019699, partial [Electrophorus voltai]